MYSLTATQPFIGTTSNYQADGKRFLALDFIAFNLAMNRYNIRMSKERNFLS
jgi:hypothetical protein